METRRAEELRARIAGLKIQVFNDEAGNLIACSDLEPCFCVVRTSEQDLRAVVIDTLESYVRRFYNLEVPVTFDEDVSKRAPKEIRVTPRDFLRPVLGFGLSDFAAA